MRLQIIFRVAIIQVINVSVCFVYHASHFADFGMVLSNVYTFVVSECLSFGHRVYLLDETFISRISYELTLSLQYRITDNTIMYNIRF